MKKKDCEKTWTHDQSYHNCGTGVSEHYTFDCGYTACVQIDPLRAKGGDLSRAEKMKAWKQQHDEAHLYN